MAGIVVSKTGTGGITINIPLQFETIDHLAKVIIDDITAGGGTGPNPHQDAIQLPATLKTLANMTTGTFSALPAVVSDATMATMNAANTAINNASTGLMPQIMAGATQVNGTVVSAMKQLNAFAGAADFGAAKTAMAAFPPPNLLMGGVMEVISGFERFQNMTSGMQGEGNLGSAVSQLNSIAKNAGTLGACGNLATAIASDIGMSAPPAINAAFTLLEDGVANTQTQIIAQSMKAVKDVLDMSHSSGRMDDLNDVIRQIAPVSRTAAGGTYSGQTVMSIELDNETGHTLIPTDGERTGGKTYVNIPGWTNPNTGLTEYIPATKLVDSLTDVESTLLSKTNAIKSAIESSLAPIEELTSAIGLAASAGNLPAALNSALSSAVKTAMTNARADVSANPHVDPAPPAGAPPDEGGAGRPK
tara:strand:- start:1853 stop:3106 length:1254 start_codon:yes stop_codon:yes gene_type:complete